MFWSVYMGGASNLKLWAKARARGDSCSLSSLWRRPGFRII